MARELGAIRRWAVRNARKVVVGVIGTTVILLGVFMLFLPGPGLVTVFVGLTILAAEFAWARRWLRRAKQMAGEAASKVTGNRWGPSDPPENPAP